jgi:hypothetical protein
MTEYLNRHTMERMQEHLVRADGELESAQHFLDPGSAEGAEMDVSREVAAARVAVDAAFEVVRPHVGERHHG